MKRSHILTTAVLIGIASAALLAQDESEEPSRRQIPLQLDYHSQRVKLLKARLEIMKSLHAAQTEQAKMELKTLNVQRQMAQTQLQQAEARLDKHERSYQRIKQLLDTGAATEQEMEQAGHHLTAAKLEIQALRLEVEGHAQKSAHAELSMKQQGLDAELQRNEVQLELLEAEHAVKELQLELDSQ